MNIENVAALLVRTLGLVLIMIAFFLLSGLGVAYATAVFSHQSILNNAYFVVYDSVVWGALFTLTGILSIIFSKVIGRLLA